MTDFAQGVWIGCVVGVVLAFALLLAACAMVATDPRQDEEEL